ncbi:hypothetical protein OsI_28938 [Oryza sativa Indica Group]|jgi:hypothetical protein|uniref:Uncharacterized protein n=1 Tax=Oryza sativa subsp. indica TaxID=39946 RepID=B8BA08_ORYSI|nr:hypothetical protein OsI_28938 [Oryza sativa Indica Group]
MARGGNAKSSVSDDTVPMIGFRPGFCKIPQSASVIGDVGRMSGGAAYIEKYGYGSI